MNVDGPSGCHCGLEEDSPHTRDNTLIIFEDDGVRVLLRTLRNEEDEVATNANVLALAIARRVRLDPQWKEDLIEDYLQSLQEEYM